MTKAPITEISILPIKPRQGLVGFCSFVLWSTVYVGDVGLHLRPDGQSLRLVYPVRTLKNGKQVACVHPIERATADAITQSVNDAYWKLVQKSGENYEKEITIPKM